MNIRKLRNFSRHETIGNCCRVSKVSNLNAKLKRNLYPNKNFFINTEQSKAVADFIGNSHSPVIQQGHEKQAEQCGYYQSAGTGWMGLTVTACLE